MQDKSLTWELKYIMTAYPLLYPDELVGIYKTFALEKLKKNLNSMKM